MSNLLNKYKGVSPTPKPFKPITIEQIKRYKKQIHRQNYINRLKKIFCRVILVSAILFTAYNYVRYCRSFDNCQRLLAEIKKFDEANSYLLGGNND